MNCNASCLCGEIELTISGPITDIIHCHCSLCRKSSGTAFATNGYVYLNNIKFINGKDLLSHFESNPGKKKHFCRKCASSIYSSNSDGLERVRLRLGTLDSNISESPGSHNFMSSKSNWFDLDANIPRHEEHELNRSKS